ncbi:MAG: hypothetical protein NT154_13645 [Verrucomicrobia bacterium]|nr:hypothetical protein [Verrucomicrobiota bacterium]
MANKDEVARLEHMSLSRVLPVHLQHSILEHVRVTVGPKPGELFRALEQSGRHFDATQGPDRIVLAGVHPVRQQPDAKDQNGHHHQAAQRARSADI